MNDDTNENNANNYRIDSNKTATSKVFAYKTKIIGGRQLDNNTIGTEVVVPLKYWSNFWRSLDFPFINREMNIAFSWLKDFIMRELLRISAINANPAAVPTSLAEPATSTTSARFQVNSTKLYFQ